MIVVRATSVLQLVRKGVDGKADPEIYIGSARLVEALPGEALYVPRPYENKRQFIEAHEHVDDHWYDDEKQEILRDKFFEMYLTDTEGLEEVLRREKGWENYTAPTATPVAVHVDPCGGGSLVWIGDLLEEDTRMRSVLALLMTTDFHARKQEYSSGKCRY